MNSDQKSQIEKTIRDKLEKVTNDIAMLKEQTKPISPDNAYGRVSRMDAINNKSVAEANLRQAENTIKRLNIALDHLKSDDFGKCISCGSEINPKRLMIMPESRKCIRCASRG
jgi:DnaK suppressor protein